MLCHQAIFLCKFFQPIMFRKGIHFPAAEEEVLAYWRRIDAFGGSKTQSEGRPDYVFYDGPPFATGLPHYGHILSGTIKDTIGRFMVQQGYRVQRRFGWDCHGLPVEYEIDKKLGITSRAQVTEMGVAAYNDACKAVVMKYADEWEHIVERMGRWVDFKGGYRTMDRSFMESTWFVFAQLFRRGKVYRGFKVMPFSTACKTPLSNFEANQNYKDVSDPSVLISFPLTDSPLHLVAWTTTPWTLPANCVLAVNPKLMYAVIEHAGKRLVIAESRVNEYFRGSSIVERIEGKDLVGHSYAQPFQYYENLRSHGFFRVLAADFVSDASGTAVVHCSPAFGEEDYKICVENGLLTENGEAPCPIDEDGCFTLDPYRGVYIKDLDKLILRDIKDRVLMNNRVVHSYPFCWRSDTPLVYRLVPNWFIRVKEARTDLLRNNELVNWVPADIKYRRFHNWLENARDWAVGRNRFWGTPIPIWVPENCEDGSYEDAICIGSIAELEKLSGTRVDDLHRQFVDSIVIEKNGKRYRRVEEVLDCWFESGSMPYAQDHWPFATQEEGGQEGPSGISRSLEGLRLSTVDNILSVGESSDKPCLLAKERFPADFIGEGLDQTRGWFYTLHVISTLLFGSPAFKNVICFGIVLAEDGKKMSKRLKNYPDPQTVFERHGADALRLYLLSSPVVSAENLRFSERGVHEIVKTVLIPWYNTLAFYIECKDGSEAVSRPLTETDLWIVSSFDTFCSKVSFAANALHLSEILGYTMRFIDDLSNWFVRINRKSLRADGSVLRRLLVDFSTVMAPFLPFFSEYCYQSVKDKLAGGSGSAFCDSVHHTMYPKTKESRHPFENAKNVIEAVRQMRERLRLKLKRPLRLATIVCSPATERILKPFTELIVAECNLLNLKFESEDLYSFTTSVKPCYGVLRGDLGTMKKKLSFISKMGEGEIIALLADGRVAVDETLFVDKEDTIITKEFVGVEHAQTFGAFGLVLDVSIDEEIVERTAAREFYSLVQQLRKNAGLVPEDSVAVSVDSTYLHTVVGRFYPDVVFGREGTAVAEGVYEHDDDPLRVELFRQH